MGYLGVFMAIGQGTGPLIGGILSEKVSWRWCFWVTPPIGVAGIGIVLFLLPLKKVEGDMKRKLKAIDYFGSLLSLGAGTLLILPLIWGGITFPWNSAIVLAILISSPVAFIMFCLWEWKVAKLPIVPMYIFKHLTVSGVYIAMFINGFIYNSAVYYLPQFFQAGLGYSPLRSGLFLLPVVVSTTVASICTGLSISRTGKYRLIIYSGFGMMALGCGLVSIVTVTTNKAAFVVFMLILGLGSGQTSQPTTVAAQASVPRKDMSVVTAVRNYMRQLGATVALAAGSTILNNSLRSRMNELQLPKSTVNGIVDNPTIIPTLSNSSTSPFDLSPAIASSILSGYTKGFHSVFYLNAALSTFCVVITVFMIKHKELTRPDEAEMKRKAEEDYRNKGKGKISDVEASAQKDGSMELTELGSTQEQRSLGVEQSSGQTVLVSPKS